ncbi:MAG: hypothetical protein CEN92_303, partial [Candidatus Berkelbacteria bacterium Licking1014_96]
MEILGTQEELGHRLMIVSSEEGLTARGVWKLGETPRVLGRITQEHAEVALAIVRGDSKMAYEGAMALGCNEGATLIYLSGCLSLATRYWALNSWLDFAVRDSRRALEGLKDTPMP